jgi:hypothetical protein
MLKCVGNNSLSGYEEQSGFKSLVVLGSSCESYGIDAAWLD